MKAHAVRVVWATLMMACFAALAQAQMVPDVAARIQALGPVINPPATAAIYAPRMLEKEPYAGVTVQRDVRYGEDARNLLDIFAPEAKSAAPRAVFMFVHGGAFIRGDRRGAPGSPFYDNVMLWAVRNGMIGVNLTYRLAPAHKWPAGAQDVGQAVRWVHDHIAAAGGDPTRVFLMGHSAGAIHVATYVAQPQFQQVPRAGVAGALILSALYNFTPALMSTDGGNKVYLGDDPDRWAERSPFYGLLGTRVPLWIGYAELDPPAFVAQAEEMDGLLCHLGRCPALSRFAGHSHMSEIYSVNSDDHQVGDAMLAFVKAH